VRLSEERRTTDRPRNSCQEKSKAQQERNDLHPDRTQNGHRRSLLTTTKPHVTINLQTSYTKASAKLKGKKWTPGKFWLSNTILIDSPSLYLASNKHNTQNNHTTISHLLNQILLDGGRESCFVTCYSIIM
jgi:hypothetical protein